MLIDYQLGQTSIILRVKIRSSSTGNGLTGLTGSSTGLIIGTITDVEATTTAYTQASSQIQTIATLGTYAAPSASDCRFAQVDATNHPGVYEVQLANARYAVSNAKSLMVSITGVSGMLDCDVLVPLRSVNPYDGVHGGMSCLPNTAVTTNGSLLTAGTGTSQINTDGAGDVYSLSNIATLYNGAVWCDTNNGTAGTTNYVNGVQSKPANSIANTTTIASSLGIKRFQFLPESSITLAQGYRDYFFGGENWTVALGGQDISGCSFNNAVVSGIATATNAAPTFFQCQFGTTTAPPSINVLNSQVGGTVTLASGGGNFNFMFCTSNGTPVFDLGASHSAITLRLREWQGGVTLKHVFTGDTIAIDGFGQVTVDSTCTGGTIGMHGPIDLVNNGSGITFSQVARLSSDSAAGPYPCNVTQINAVSTASVTTVDAVIGATGDPYAQLNTLIPHAFTYDTNNLPKVALTDIINTALTESSAGYLSAGFKEFFNVASPVLTVASVNQSGDSYAIVNNGTYGNSALHTQIGTLPSAATIATTVLTDTTSGDLSTSGSIGYILAHQLAGAFTTSSSSVYTTASLANAPTGGSAPTVGQIATAVWQDTTSGDFTVSGSIGKSLFTSGNAPGAASGIALVGSNVGAASSVTGNVGGSVASVTGAVGSVTSVTNIVSGGAITTSGGKVSEVALVDTLTTYTGNTPQSGDAYGVVNNGTYGNSALHTALANLFTTALTEAYAANNVAPTMAQIMFMIYSAIQNFSISGTTISLQEINGSTTWGTVTLNSATNPTSRVRAT